MQYDYLHPLAASGLVSICALILSACQEPQPSPTLINYSQADGSQTIVLRGNAAATLADMEVYLQRMPEHHKGLFLSDPKRVSDGLGSILRPRQLTAHARAEAVPFLDDPVFRASLEQDTAKKIADRYMDWRWEQEVLEDYSAKAEELFLTRPDLFQKPLHVDFTQILIRADHGYGELAAVEGISRVFDELRNDEPLSEIAANPPPNVNLDESSRRFDNVALDALEPTVAEVLAAISPGDISEPFRSEYGWHIVELHRRYRPEVGSFEANRERALELARRRHRTDFTERLLRKINNEPVEFVQEGLDKLKERYPLSIEQEDRLQNEVTATSAEDKETADEGL